MGRSWFASALCDRSMEAFPNPESEFTAEHQRSRSIMRPLVILFMAGLLPHLASAKRSAPAKVEPLIHEGVRYVTPNDDGRRAYIEAWDVQTNKKLWDLTVFTNRIDPKLEEDVQWVFIKAIRVENGVLLVTSERGNTYEIDLKTKAITQSDAPSSIAVDDLSETVKRALANGAFAKDYDISPRVNPSFLHGDFDGDGRMDVATLVKQRSTGKFGIAIVHGANNKVTILGAGTSIGNGGDDFEWMDSWEIYSKDRAIKGTNTPKLHGDALLVSKSEAASALIYWNGKRYVWLQQGD